MHFSELLHNGGFWTVFAVVNSQCRPHFTISRLVFCANVLYMPGIYDKFRISHQICLLLHTLSYIIAHQTLLHRVCSGQWPMQTPFHHLPVSFYCKCVIYARNSCSISYFSQNLCTFTYISLHYRPPDVFAPCLQWSIASIDPISSFPGYFLVQISYICQKFMLNFLFRTKFVYFHIHLPKL
jgi:hypothetical protein